MEDPVDVNRRIEQLVARVRRRDVYGRLLASGEVILPVEKVPDPDAWRAEIRRQARSDRLKVQTGVTAGKVWAMLAGDIPEAQQDENLRYFHLFTSDLEPRAAALGHQVRVVIRDGEEALLICRACGARGYADAAAGPLIGGPLFDDECPEGDPRRRLTSSGSWAQSSSGLDHGPRPTSIASSRKSAEPTPSSSRWM